MKKKICFIVSTPYTAKAFLENHFEVLSNHYDLYLVAKMNDMEIVNYSNIHLKEIKHIPIFRKINIFQDIKALFLLTKYLKSNHFHAVITFTPKAGLIGIISGKFAGIKKRIHFFTGQVWHTKRGMFKRFLMFLDKVLVNLSTDIIVDGRPQQEFLISNNILSENNSIIIGRGTISGIDLKIFCPKPEIRNKIRESLNYTDEDIVFMFLGRLNRDKGILDLAMAFNKLQVLYPRVKLLIVGPDEENISEKLRVEFQSNDNYYLYGGTTEPEKLMQACDVFCLPSHREAFGLSVIEASACEKPIICSDTYGLKDTIVDNFTGLRHIAHDTESIFEKIKMLVEDDVLRHELGINGRKYIQEFFSKEKITFLWLQYFNLLFSDD
ncbi:glycosyltransferase [Flavobacterium sp. RSP29]|uniref:glycosyltransferase n=1 Tax=Flavobacterium sp. RSP29 TaxID=3401731 RepID=UPI003AAF054F